MNAKQTAKKYIQSEVLFENRRRKFIFAQHD